MLDCVEARQTRNNFMKDMALPRCHSNGNRGACAQAPWLPPFTA